MHKRRLKIRIVVASAFSLCALCACGQKGALYLPDHAPKLVLPAPAATATATATATGADAVTPDTPATRKAPRDPDPATAR